MVIGHPGTSSFSDRCNFPIPTGDDIPMTRRDRATGALLGLAIGDALGTTLEFTERDSQEPVSALVGGGPFGLQPGQWTDDTSMALALADSLLDREDLDPNDLMQRFVAWWRRGENSCTGTCFDIGATTRSALAHFEFDGDPMAGSTDPWSAGNGSLMRLAPVAIRWHRNPERARAAAREQSRTTHGAPAAVAACDYYADLLVEAIEGGSKEALLRPRRHDQDPSIKAVAEGSWKGQAREQIASSGYVVHTLEAALWAIDRADGFETALTTGVNMGGDADTVGAVTGQLAGALWGTGAIPLRWTECLAWGDHILDLADRLFEAGETQSA